MANPRNRYIVFYSIALVAGFIVSLVVWDVHQDQLRAYDEKDLIADLKETTPAPEPEQGVAEFPESLEDPRVGLQLRRVSRELGAVIDACLTGWPDHPREARVRLSSDAAGRMQTLAVEAAPDPGRPAS